MTAEAKEEFAAKGGKVTKVATAKGAKAKKAAKPAAKAKKPAAKKAGKAKAKGAGERIKGNYVAANKDRELRADRAAMVITVKAKENPKREGTGAYDRFKLYKTGMTVKQYITKGGIAPDVWWDSKQGFISLKAGKAA